MCNTFPVYPCEAAYTSYYPCAIHWLCVAAYTAMSPCAVHWLCPAAYTSMYSHVRYISCVQQLTLPCIHLQYFACVSLWSSFYYHVSIACGQKLIFPVSIHTCSIQYFLPVTLGSTSSMYPCEPAYISMYPCAIHFLCILVKQLILPSIHVNTDCV